MSTSRYGISPLVSNLISKISEHSPTTSEDSPKVDRRPDKRFQTLPKISEDSRIFRGRTDVSIIQHLSIFRGLCNHSSGDLFTFENNRLFSFVRVKISSLRVKAHLVFHWCLYNKQIYNKASI